jgi:hypothetical protein
MEFSLGRDTLPSQARSVRGESRRLRRERDNAKTHLFRCLLRRVAQRDRAAAIMRPVFSATWRTAADAKSVHDHLSRHHAGLIRERARFEISLSAGAYMPAHGRRWPQMAVEHNEQSLRLAFVCRLDMPPPPHATAGWTGCGWTGEGHFHGRAELMSGPAHVRAGPDHASPVTPRNHTSPVSR